MRNRLAFGGLALALCALGVGLASELYAQERAKREKECCPAVVQTPARYTYHRSGTESVVFDTFSGRIYTIQARDTLRETDPVVGVVKIRKLEQQDERGGAVIRQVPR